MIARAALVALGLLFGCSCATLRPLTAGSGDLADYRAFRVASAPGTRLARAKRYLDQHPRGAFVEEVRASWDDEEPRYFARAQASQEGARSYLADLPDGPHAAAALALLTALGSTMQDAELRDIARKSRYDDAKLEAAAVQRRAVGEAILGAVGVLLDEEVYGVARGNGPPPLRTLMMGRTTSTWGAVPARRDEDLYFLLPTRPDRESRLVSLEITLAETDGLVTGGTVAGADLFVAWAEADQIVKLDPTSADDRTEAHVHAMDRLEGALERRFPGGECPDARVDNDLYHRSCNGWEARITPGGGAGRKDSIVVRGSAGPARRQGVR